MEASQIAHRADTLTIDPALRVQSTLRKPSSGCCARAASDHVATPPSAAMNSRRFIQSLHRRWLEAQAARDGRVLLQLSG